MTRFALLSLATACLLTAGEDAFLRSDAGQAKKLALSTRVNGQVGKSLDLRIVATDRSINYKLRATWMTPPVIRATARLHQIAGALSDPATKQLVADAESVGDIVIQVEIDPREGSGVIPNNWVALLGPAASPRKVRGTNSPKLRDLPALSGGARRDYAYDVFWLVFPAKGEDGLSLFSSQDREAELTVQIYGKIGRVRWPVPAHLISAR